MDHLFLELIGKPALNPPKIITVVAENFSLLEDQARFLKATLAIPAVKQLPFDNISKRLIQIGPLQGEIGELLRKAKWAINQYEDFSDSICDRIEEDLNEVRNRSIIFVNDASRLELCSTDLKAAKKLIALAIKLKRARGHFVVMLYQGSIPNHPTSTFLRDLEYLSDAVVKVKSCKIGYFKSIWWQTIPTSKTLIPSKVETNYCTCKVGKFYYSSELLCFYERRKVSKDYDLNSEVSAGAGDDQGSDQEGEEEELSSLLSANSIAKPTEEDKDLTLPYTRAQNPEKSRIFYYPDKEDDIDEDDLDDS